MSAGAKPHVSQATWSQFAAAGLVPIVLAGWQIVPLLMTGSSLVPIAILSGAAVLTSAVGVLAVAVVGRARGVSSKAVLSSPLRSHGRSKALLRGWMNLLLLALPTGVLIAGTMMAQDLLVALGVVLVIATIVVAQVMLVLVVGRQRGTERGVGPSWAP